MDVPAFHYYGKMKGTLRRGKAAFGSVSENSVQDHLMLLLLSQKISWVAVAHTFNPSACEGEAWISLEFETRLVYRESRLQATREILSQKKKIKKIKNYL